MRLKMDNKAPSGRNTRSSQRNPPIPNNPPSASAASAPVSSKELHGNCLKALGFMKSLGLDLGTLVDSVFYGDTLSRASSVMKSACASLVQTDKFLRFLTRVHDPPRGLTGRATQAYSGRNTLTAFAVSLTQAVLKSELTAFFTTFHIEKISLIEVNIMEEITSVRLGADMKELCPNLWDTLAGLAGNEEAILQTEENDEAALRKEATDTIERTAQGKDARARADGEEGVDKATLDGYGASVKPHPNFVCTLYIHLVSSNRPTREP